MPQGSILGVFLFNVAIDDLEGDLDDPLQRDGGEGNTPGEWLPPAEGGLEDAGGNSRSERLDRRLYQSSPIGVSVPESPGLSPVREGGGYEGENTRFVFLSGVRNIRRELWEEEEVPPEPNPRTSAKWREKDLKMFKYVDDCCMCEKINTETGVAYELGDTKHKVKHAVPCLLYTSPSPRD